MLRTKILFGLLALILSGRLTILFSQTFPGYYRIGTVKVSLFPGASREIYPPKVKRLMRSED